jgi:ABC-type transport system involved in multi-copper enzyme maturation permease subunit
VSLYKAETRRLVKRRFTRYFTLAALLLLVAVAVGMFFTNQKVSPATVARAQAQAEAEYQQSLVDTERVRADCKNAAGTPNATNFPPDCAEITPPGREQFQAEWYMPSTFDFRQGFGNMLTALAAILALVAFVVGASFVGAEWNSGGMMNLLLWRPQRVKVLGTKLAALLVGLTTLTVVTAAVWTAGFWLIASLRGSTEKMTSGAWQSFALTGLRGLILVLAVGAVGFALASMGRHTAMALGVAIGVVVVFQFGLGTVLAMAGVRFLEAYLLPSWVQAWMGKKVKLEDWESCNVTGFSGECTPDTMNLTWQMSGGLMAAVVVLVVGAAMWTMRSRDVT